MKRLQYISRWSKILSEEELRKIEYESAYHNAKKNISGFLISLDDIFFQFLEGDNEGINELYFNKIINDPRHKDVICIKNESNISERAFPHWSMKLFNLSAKEQILPDVFKAMFDTLINSQHILLKYTQPSVVDILSSGIDPTSIPPKKVEKVIFMTDIVGFSLLSERYPAEIVVNLINRFIEICSDKITKYGGEINKLIGDSAMAVFPYDHANQAIEAGIEILSEVKKLRSLKNTDIPYKLLYCGIGITAGKVIEGNVGSIIKKDYTFIGNTVNIAARIEALTRNLNRTLLFSNSVYKQVKEKRNTESLGNYEIKGKLEIESIYSLKEIPAINMLKIYEKIKDY